MAVLFQIARRGASPKDGEMNGGVAGVGRIFSAGFCAEHFEALGMTHRRRDVSGGHPNDPGLANLDPITLQHFEAIGVALWKG